MKYPGLLFVLALSTAAAPRAAIAAGKPGSSEPRAATGDGKPKADAPAPAAQDTAAPAASAAGSAGDASVSSAAERAAALYREGNTFYDQSKFIEAEARYQAAWDLQRSFDVAGNLGNVELVVNQPRDAAEHLSYALEIFPLGEKADKKKFLQKRLAQAKALVGAVKVAVNADGAEVLVDGKLVGRSPLASALFVDPGEHTLEARLGSRSTSAAILVEKGSEQGASLTFDGGPNMAVLVAGGAVGVVGVAAGVTFALLSNGKASDAEAQPAGSAARADLRDDQTTFANASFWGFVGGGAVLVGTAIYAVTTVLGGAAADAPATGVRVSPLVTARGGGVAVGGSF